MKPKFEFFEYDSIGYHGHRTEQIREIIHEGKFYFSSRENEWLGTGLYFFENDILQAINWCIKARQYQSWSIIKAKIKSNKLIDLDKTSHFDEFEKFVKKLKERYRRNGGKKQITTKVIFDFLYEVKPYDLIRHTFDVPSCFNIEPTFIKRKQVQICVRNLECIISFEEVELDGH